MKLLATGMRSFGESSASVVSREEFSELVRLF